MLLLLVDGLLELLSPERCVVCGVGRGDAPWAAVAPGSAPQLATWHRPHLCAGCLARWLRAPVAGRIAGHPLWAALPEEAALVRTVGAWKYHGVRGLARGLSTLLVGPLRAAAGDDPRIRVVPVPLHGRRRRERGFDQCRQLAVLACRAAGLVTAADVLVRRRSTGQQASCPATGAERARNVAGAFVARPPRDGEPTRLILLDDLATTGATLASAAASTAAAGWQVAGLVALGRAARLREGAGLTSEGDHR